MPLGLPGLAASLLPGGQADPLSAFTDTGSAVSGASLGPVTIGGLNPAPQTFDVQTIALGVGLTFAAGVLLFSRKRKRR